jgi:hypothetical protein
MNACITGPAGKSGKQNWPGASVTAINSCGIGQERLFDERFHFNWAILYLS